MGSSKKHLIARIAVICLMLSSLHPQGAQALTLENVTFVDEITIGGKRVPIRNAALLRYMKVIRVYVAALYLPKGITSEAVLSDVPKRLELTYLVSIEKHNFGKGAAPTLERNNTPAELARLQGRIERINAAYKDVKPGDRYSLTYLPGRGTELALNGTPLITIEGADFAAAYFGIWLGRSAFDDGLKRDLLKGF